MIALGLIVFGICALILCAPTGYQDEAGFNYGEDPRNPQ